ncbi:MAG TPA: plastocyanin/azurin family copper-binding protein [Ktedonobacteraceae bacterium]
MGTESKDLRVDAELQRKLKSHVQKKHRSSPRPLSVFSKTFLVVLLVHAGLLTALGLFVQQPVVLILAGIEAFVASLTLFGLRWVPIIGSLLGFAMLLIFLTATGFPIHHLTHPKDAFGYGVLPALSFLMYVVMSGLFWCAAMLLVTGVATVIHTYFFARWQNFPWFKTALTGAICIWCGAVMVGALTQPDRPINTLSPGTVALEVGSFSPSSISLTKGEHLTIVDSGAYHHNLSMGRWINGQPVLQNQPGAPSLTNKDVNAAGQTVVLGPFNTAGTFYLMCSLHHNMMLKITVT